MGRTSYPQPISTPISSRRKFCKDCRLPLSHAAESDRRRTNLDILLVCKQILEEAECIWYAKTSFAFGCPMEAIRFFDTLSEKRRTAVTRLALRCPKGDVFAKHLYAFWFYLLRTSTLMKPDWLAVAIPDNQPTAMYLRRTIDNYLGIFLDPRSARRTLSMC